MRLKTASFKLIFTYIAMVTKQRTQNFLLTFQWQSIVSAFGVSNFISKNKTTIFLNLPSQPICHL